MGLQYNMSTSCTSESSPSLSRKKMILDKYKQARSACSTSSSSPEVSKEKTANEKLFDRECKELQRNLDKSFDSNVVDSSNSSDGSEPRLQNGRHSDSYDTDEDIRVPMEGVLHLKSPFINKKNESVYYESRGRMEPMDWSILNDNKNSEHSKKKNDIYQSKAEKVITINECSKRKPEVSPEFLNFEQNSTTSKKTYESDVHLMDLIDRPINESAALSSKESNSRNMPITVECTGASIIKHSGYNLNGSKELCEFDSHDSLGTLGVPNLPDVERTKCIDEHSDESLYFRKSSSKSRSIDEYDDEMFNFMKPSAKSTFNSNDVSTNSVLKTPPPKTDLHQVNKGLVTLSKSESPSSRAQLYFNKIKNMQEAKLNCSMDSDDISLGASTRHNDDSVSKKSVIFNYEFFKHKLKNTSTQYSPVHNEKREIEEKIKEKDDININEKLLTKEIQTREFIMSNRNAFTEKTNEVEISNIKIFPKAEPFLTAVSTRYFAKPLKKEEEQVDAKTNDTNQVTNKVVTTDALDIYTVKKSTTVNPNSSLRNNESNSSQDLYLSFDNTSKDEVLAVVTKDNEENRIQSYQHVTPTVIDKLQDTASREDDDHSIFCSCKYDDDTKSSLAIEEIDDSNTLENKNSIISNSNTTPVDIEALYKGMIDSDEEFDIVNVDRFPPYASIFNKLMEVKEAQKAIATGILNVDDPEFDSKVQAYTSHNNSNRAICFDKSKSTESSLEISDNYYSSIDASASSNTDSDCKTSTFGSLNSLSSNKDNIFGNLKIDTSLLDNSIHVYYGNKPERKKTNTLPNDKDGRSNKMTKIANVLNKYRKDAKPKVTEEVKKEGVQISVQLQADTTSNSKQLSKRLRLLNEIKKRKAQLAGDKH
ncbi:uncharacterized protein LOC100678321 [Nasonia vitripennis]|uniref:Uncharacterized protein n=1 Tax=Nasonia vitripennis TaxID=7425 RepID=A0A7M7GC44_NASVI|nr:uncharacterized protein LOC100678321 [Nasonia vitripennis]XP_016837836.1 uncharacterized protein LOC100678321 [Nasonia vitripennis]